MLETPTVVQSPSQKLAAIKIVVPRPDIVKVMGPAIQEIFSVMAEQGISPTGPLTAYHVNVDSKVFDFEVGFPIADEIEPGGRVRSFEMPASRVVRTVYQGPYEGLFDAWTEFKKWVDQSEYRPAPTLWEAYLTDPTIVTDPANWRTELNQPILAS